MRRPEPLRRRFDALRALALDMAHEANNPLTVVIQNLDTVAEDLGKIEDRPNGLTSDLRERIADAATAARRIAGIVEDLTAFANAAAGERRSIELAGEVEAAIRSVEGGVAAGVRIETELLSGIRVPGDAPALARALARVLRSVLETTNPGEGERIRIFLEAESNEAYIRIRRGEDGRFSGEKSHICPFRNVCHACSIRLECRSTGLGLALSRGTFESFGGSLRLMGGEGGGIEVEVRLPLHAA